jgi:hypothetical protein
VGYNTQSILARTSIPEPVSLTNAPAKITRYTRIKAICAEVKSIFHFKYFFSKLSILVLEIKYTKVKL